jgi:hypothetical protein
MMVFDRCNPVAARGKLRNDFLNQRRLARVFGADDVDNRRTMKGPSRTGMRARVAPLIAWNAQDPSIDLEFALEVDALAALATGDPPPSHPGHVFFGYLDLHGLNSKQ